jgi:uncharacterized SAM-binding protein YcdF (DUF218 family)
MSNGGQVQGVRYQLGRVARVLLTVFGLALILQLTLPITGLQGRWARWLAAGEYRIPHDPAFIVVLGGGGIPSKSGFIRVWHGAQSALEFPNAIVIVSLPADENPEEASVGRMKRELILRGVPEERILMETRGLNTHEQAVNVRALLGDEALNESVLIVTSRYHLRRSILCFRKAGFHEVGVRAATGIGAEADIGRWVFVRYIYWQALSDQPVYLRETVALWIYRLRGWI